MKTTSQIGNAKTHIGNILITLLGPTAPCQRPSMAALGQLVAPTQ